MIKPEQIPDEVIDALRESTPWSEFWTDHEHKLFLAIAINAWPGACVFGDVSGWDLHIELPLTEEKNDV